MADQGSNSAPPTLWIELPRETVEFMVENSEVNLGLGLGLMTGGLSRATVEKLIDQNEQFKVMMQAGRKALK